MSSPTSCGRTNNSPARRVPSSAASAWTRAAGASKAVAPSKCASPCSIQARSRRRKNSSSSSPARNWIPSPFASRASTSTTATSWSSCAKIRIEAGSYVRQNVGTMSNWDQSQFDAALKAHLANTSRTIERVINGRAYFVALAAIRLTVKVSAAKIEAELGRIVRVEKISKKGRKYNRKQLQLTPGRDGRAPLAALIINKRLGRGETFHGLSGRGAYGREMRDAIKYLIGVRKRSVAFIASGWIPALRTPI